MVPFLYFEWSFLTKSQVACSQACLVGDEDLFAKEYHHSNFLMGRIEDRVIGL